MVRRLLLLNGVAIIAVVLNHASAWGFVAMFWWTDRYMPVSVPNFDQMYSASYFALRLIEQFIIFSIPSFLFVSGFFISVATGRQQSTVSWKLVGTRIKNLLIPYLIWSVVMLTFDYLQGITYTPGEIILVLFTGRAADPFYFVPLLIQLYILSPLLVPLARMHWKLLLVVTFLVEFGLRAVRYPYILGAQSSFLDQLTALTPSAFFATRIFWFALGLVIGFHLQTFKPRLFRFRWGLFVGLVFFFVLGVIEWEILLQRSGLPWIPPWETIIDGLYALAFILVFIAFDKIIIPYAKRVSNIGAKSYGIYLVHSLVLIVASKFAYHFIPAILAYQIIYQTILVTLGIGVPLMLMEIVNRSPVRRYYVYLFG